MSVSHRPARKVGQFQSRPIEIRHVRSDASDNDEDDEPGADPQPLIVRTKMERGISRATENEYLVNQARSKVENDFLAPKIPDRPPTDDPHHPEISRSETRSSPDSPDSAGSAGSGSIPGLLVAGGFIETPVYTFTLPDLTCYQDDFRRFLEKDLIELSSLISLEQSGRLNWWAEAGTCQRLWPLATTGDGNCLLHAASLGMWGFHDRLLTLRKALHSFLSSGQASAAIYRRWRWQCHLQNTQCGLTLTESEWDDEWRCVLRLASPEPRSSSAMSSSASSNGSARRRSRLSINACSLSSSPTEETEMGRTSVGGSSDGEAGSSGVSALYESLEEVHVLALAHILRRPIIVVADTILRDMNGEALAPIPFGGIYLPLECPPTDCHKSPLLLTYNAGHFSALVTMQPNNQSIHDQLPAVIPVTDSEHALLPLQFAVDPGPDFRWGEDEFLCDVIARLSLRPTEQINALNTYLDLVKVTLPEWVLDFQHQQLPPNPPKSNTSSKTTKQIQSVAKQFGSIGKKLKKNISKLGKSNHRPSSKYEVPDQPHLPRRPSDDSQHQNQRRIVSGKQSFILGATINTGKVFPYQFEMVNNYLEEARRRYERERNSKAKLRQEQIEQEEKRQREIYLNGGFVDCVNSGCDGQGTSETSYLCKTCFSHQQSLRRQQQQQPQQQQQHDGRGDSYNRAQATSCHYHPQPNGHYAKSTFYVNTPVALTGAVIPTPIYRSEDSHQRHNHLHTSVEVGEDEVDSDVMRVKLPPPTMTSCVDTRLCRNAGCEFYGTSEFSFFCSKCYSKLKQKSNVATSR